MFPMMPDESTTPTLHLLAHVAATIATKDEKPSVIARRAMSLIEACQAQLFRSAWETAVELHTPDSCGEFLLNFKIGARVNLAEFLEVMMPGSSERTRMAQWRAFRGSCLPVDELVEGVQAMSAAEKQLLGRIVERDSEDGFPRSTTLFELSQDFAEFLERDKAAKDADRGDKSKRLKPIYEIARKVLAGNAVTPADTELLKSVTPDEESRAANFLNIGPQQKGLWHSAIVDAKLPPKARPKQSAKKNQTFPW
jgi:hypothetical protein